MERFTVDHLPELLEDGADTRLSGHLPMVRAGRETRQNSIRFKNMLRAAERALEARGVGKRDAAALLERLQAAGADERLWNRQLDGLAVYATPERVRLFACEHQFDESLTIAPRFNVVPLLPLLNNARRFLVLALSRNAVRLIAASSDDAVELELGPAVPRGLTDVVGTDWEEQTLQPHSVREGTIFHGYGGGGDDRLPELETYCRRLDDALTDDLAERYPELARLPIVLAGDVQVTAMFRRAARRLPLAEESVDGNHDRTLPTELKTLSWPIIAARIAREEAELVGLYNERLAAWRASDDPEAIAAAAREGRVETLLVRSGAGRTDGEPGAEPVANPAVVATLANGGTARELDESAMPTDAPLAAIYRY